MLLRNCVISGLLLIRGNLRLLIFAKQTPTNSSISCCFMMKNTGPPTCLRFVLPNPTVPGASLNMIEKKKQIYCAKWFIILYLDCFMLKSMQGNHATSKNNIRVKSKTAWKSFIRWLLHENKSISVILEESKKKIE